MFETAVREFVERVEAACASAGISVTQFGRDAVNDPNIIHDIRSGSRSPRVATLDRLNRHLEALAGGNDGTLPADRDPSVTPSDAA